MELARHCNCVHSPRSAPMNPWMSVKWLDDRNVENYQTLWNSLRRATERRAELLIRTMPIYPDMPRVVLSQAHPLVMPRERAFANELQFRRELLRCQDMNGFRTSVAVSESPETRSSATRTCARPVCGPDVTRQIIDAIVKTKSQFSGWSTTDKERRCDQLTGPLSGLSAWDIGQLHEISFVANASPAELEELERMGYRRPRNWVLDYRPECATPGIRPPCGSTIQVGRNCYWAGSVNYVIFGVMMRLCYDYYDSVGSVWKNKHTMAAMYALIDAYKNMFGLSDADNSTGTVTISTYWAFVGYDGWPSVAGVYAPRGDRGHCRPCCPRIYHGPSFQVRWADIVF
jgi:hypothetical protein